MDERLLQFQRGLKPSSGLLDIDLEELARALTAVIRKRGSVRITRSQDRNYVIFKSPGADIAVSREDWSKIHPLIQDGTFDPQLFPVEAGFKEADPLIRFSPSNTRMTDPLYLRILGHLRLLFTATVPTAS